VAKPTGILSAGHTSKFAPVALLTSVATLLAFGQPAHAMPFLDTIVAKAGDSGFIQAFLLIFVSEIGNFHQLLQM
jgi:hypothetical protein